MSESTTTTTDMEMETMLTRAVQKLFKWQLSGLTGTLIVASMLWLAVFFVFFLILVFVMCVEYHYEKRERQDAEQALPTDNGKMWAEKRSSRETSNTSMRKIAPVPLPPLPITDEPKAVVISDMADEEEEETAPAEPEVTQESPTEAVTEESVIVDAPQDEPIESPPPPEVEEAAPTEDNPENTQDGGEVENAEEPEAEPEAEAAAEESQPEPEDPAEDPAEEPAEDPAPPENDSEDTNVVESSAEEEVKPAEDSPTAPDKNGED